MAAGGGGGEGVEFKLVYLLNVSENFLGFIKTGFIWLMR